MRLTVREKADLVATYRHIAVFLMETLARWVPTSPELEAKALFGRHLWELAQHADQFGHRTAELRAALHESRAPVPAYRQALDALAGACGTAERLGGFYDVILPDLERRYRAYLAATDALMDEPSTRIFERALTDFGRMRREKDELLRERRDLAAPDGDGPARLARMAAACEECVEFRAPAGAVAEAV